MKRNLIAILLCFVFSRHLGAQSTNMQGRVFWLTFFENYGGNFSCSDNSTPLLKIVVSAEQAASGSISNPQTNASFSFSIGNGGGMDTVLIPATQAYLTASESNTQKNRALLVQSNAPVSVAAHNIKQSSFDASTILPTEALDVDYYVFSNAGDPSGSNPCYRSCFAIVATEDSTTIDITPSCATMGGKSAGTTFSIVLHRGESYLIKAASSTLDLSGTSVKARNCKRIAVFGGANKSSLLFGNCANSYDHLYEQLIPIKHWGYRYICLPTYYAKASPRKAEMVKVIAAYSSTAVRCNGRIKILSNPGQSDTFFTTTDAIIISSKPVGVTHYGISQSCDRSFSSDADPMMIGLSPLNSFINKSIIGVDDVNSGNKKAINVITLNAYRDSFTLDGLTPANNWKKVLKDSNYAYLHIDSLPSGKHVLYSPYGFSAIQYTYGDVGGMGLQCGFNPKAASLQPSINANIISLPTINACPLSMLNFDASTVNPAYSFTKWLINDDTNILTKTSKAFAYQYQHEGSSNVVLIAQTNNNGLCKGQAYSYDSIYFSINVYPATRLNFKQESACKGDTASIRINQFYRLKINQHFWTFNGKDTVFKDSSIRRPLSSQNRFIFQYRDSNQCLYRDTMMLNALNTGNAHIESNKGSKVCRDSSIQVWASLGDQKTATSYLWIYNRKDSISNTSSISRTASKNAEFILVLRDSNACINLDTMSFESIALPDFNWNDTYYLCMNDTLHILPLVASGHRPFNYRWYSNDSLLSVNDSSYRIEGKRNIELKLTISNARACTYTDSMRLVVWSLPQFKIQALSTYKNNDSIRLSLDKVMQSYQWFNGITTKENHFWGASLGDPGHYWLWCTGTDSLGCRNTDSLEILLRSSSAVPSISNNKIRFYPNPANDVLHIELNSAERVTIINAEGKTIFQQSIQAGKHDIQLSELSRGWYSLQIGDKNHAFLKD